MRIATISRESFSLNPCSLVLDYQPYSREMYDSLEILALLEAYAYAFARSEGPLPLTPSLPPWNAFIVNHTWYLTNQTTPPLANYWNEFISWFWQNSREGPLSQTTLLIIKHDIKQLFFQYNQLQIEVACTAGLVPCFYPGFQTSINMPIVTIYRTDFLRPDIIVNTEHLGLLLRLKFDSKERPRKKWNNEDYLAQHEALLAKINENHSSESELSLENLFI